MVKDTPESVGFGFTDYTILIGSQVLCLAVGFYYGREGLTHGTLEGFALANRNIAVLPAALSIFATCYSGFGMTAMVGEMYMHGLGYMIYNIFYGFAGFFVAYAIVPIFFKAPYVSVYEFNCKMIDTEKSNFGILDYIILVASQVICLGIGLYYGRKGLTHGTLEGFALANRNIAVLPAAMSIFATCYSGFGMTAIVGEMYMYGLGYLLFNIWYGIGGLFVAYSIVPMFFKTPYVSVYEYVEKRFNKQLRITYVITYILQQVLYISVVMYVPAISLSVITKLPYWSTLLTFSIFCTAYSSVGGMKAVIVTDVLQTILMVCCVFSIVIKGFLDAGGFWNVWDIGVSGQRIGGLYLVESSTHRYSIWAMMFGGLVNGLNYLGTSQAGVQRILSVRGETQGRRSLIGGAVCFMVFSILTAMAAVVIYVNYYNCEPTLRSRETGIATEDQIVVYYISTVLSKYPGLAGLATAGIFSGSLSSLSSYINTFATITIQDLIIPNTRRKIGRKSRVILCRILTVLYGSLCTGIALVVPYIGRATPIVTTVFGVFGGPLTGVFFLGIFFRRANTKAALIALVISITFGMWIAVGNKLTHTPVEKLPLSVDGCETSNFDYLAMTSEWNEYNSTLNTQHHYSNNATNEHLENIHKSVESNDDTFPLYKISFAWYLPIGFFSTIIIGVIVSYLTTPDKSIDESLFSHLVFGSCLEEKVDIDNENAVGFLCNKGAELSPALPGELEKLNNNKA